MLQKRVTAVGAFFLLVLLVLIVSLAVLVFAKGPQLTAAASEQRLRSFSYYQYARGDILDRYGRQLVNTEQQCLVVLPAMMSGMEDQAAAVLSGLLEQEQEEVSHRLKAADSSSFQPVVLKTGLTAEQASEVNAAQLPGVLVLTLAARYEREHTASQLIGYVQPVGEQGGYAGISGLEKQYDELLAGRSDLQVRIQVDARGNMNGEVDLYQPETVQAASLSLTLDKDYQQIAEQALADMGLAGSCVVMNPNNGDILALASYPGFDPYGWQAAPDGAYIQRALLLYPPASTFKTVLAAAALEEGVRPAPAAEDAVGDEAGSNSGEEAQQPEGEAEDEAENGADNQAGSGLFVCSGSYTLPDGRVVSCAGGQAHGEVGLSQALSQSCNCYFVALGQALGGERVLSYSRRLGLDQLAVIGLDRGNAAADFLSFDGDQAGELANACLGEDGVQLSPVQEAALFSVFVNGGFLVQPRLVRATDDGVGRVRNYTSAQPRRVLDTADAETLRLMLTLVVAEGTGQAAAGQWVSAGGKTGSSETDTVWFSGFFPADQPELVVVVCLEHGSSGGAEAAAVFSQVADAITLLDGRI